jgi:hypothetical protein
VSEWPRNSNGCWNRTYEALTEQPVHTTVLRRRLRLLSCRILWHPFWSTGPGRSPAARVELRRQVRARTREVAEVT